MSVTKTVAPEIAAPDGSVTRPYICPATVWAPKWDAAKNVNAVVNANRLKQSDMVEIPSTKSLKTNSGTSYVVATLKAIHESFAVVSM